MLHPQPVPAGRRFFTLIPRNPLRAAAAPASNLVAMSPAESTCWTLIRAAAAGSAEDRAGFARSYEGPLRAFFGARWRRTSDAPDVHDAVQEVFLECFREGGVLNRADESRPGGFRAFLYGTARNVALRVEERRARDRRGRSPEPDLGAIAADETSVSDAYERAWARMLLREAARVMAERASSAGGEAAEQIRVLERRFVDGLPIRDIAKQSGADPVRLHRLYQKSLRTYRVALEEVVARHLCGSPGEIQRECRRLQDLLGGDRRSRHAAGAADNTPSDR